MLKINQRASGLRSASPGGGGTNGETKRPRRFSVHWKRNETYEEWKCDRLPSTPNYFKSKHASCAARAARALETAFQPNTDGCFISIIYKHYFSGINAVTGSNI